MSQQPVLIVEDEPDGQELVARMLSQVDLAVDVADDAEQAWPLLLSKHYSAVVIDLALPGMDGFQLLRAIRQKPELDGVHCVAITAFHTPELKQQALQEGFNGYFAKPLDGTRFLSALEGMVSKS